MANYDRRILVPYLQDVCTSEMLCNKLERDLQECKNNICNLTNTINQNITELPKPVRSEYSSYQSGNKVVWTIFAVIPTIIGLALLADSNFIVGLIVILIGAFFGFCGWSDVGEENEKDDKRYLADVREYENRHQMKERYTRELPEKKEQLQKWKNYQVSVEKHLEEAKKLRNDLYSVNVIPMRYRNIYVAYYLYDYFSSCRENDLDKIIQTMLLDEIIRRLDKVIIQNEQLLLNQRMQIALQERQNRSLAEHHRKELQSIARMERNQELQMDYQHMIAQNQVVTNFLLAAEYMKKYG